MGQKNTQDTTIVVVFWFECKVLDVRFLLVRGGSCVCHGYSNISVYIDGMQQQRTPREAVQNPGLLRSCGHASIPPDIRSPSYLHREASPDV